MTRPRRSSTRRTLARIALAATLAAAGLWIASYFLTIRWVFAKHHAVALGQTSITWLAGRDDQASGTAFAMTTGFEYKRALPPRADWAFDLESTPFYRRARIPLWFCTALPAIVTLILARAARAPAATCPQCGYSRQGIGATVACPECGGAPPAADPRPRRTLATSST